MLFAVLVSSLLLSVGLSIFNLTIKELALSSAGRESQFAFYAADTGADCALFYDLKSPNDFVFATSTDSDDPGNISCNGLASAVSEEYSLDGWVNSFSFKPVSDGEACVFVTVTKNIGGDPETKIEARGYNVGYNTTDCDGQSPIKVERAVRFIY